MEDTFFCFTFDVSTVHGYTEGVLALAKHRHEVRLR